MGLCNYLGPKNSQNYGLYVYHSGYGAILFYMLLRFRYLSLNLSPCLRPATPLARSRSLLYSCGGFFRWTPHPVIVTIRDNRDYIRVLLYSYYATITGWGVLVRDS